jgi:predicted transposase/invertase (TIGR01784 family)
LDVLVETASGRRINVEVQLDVRADLVDRIIYYHSKMVAQRLAPGSDYGRMNQCVTIVVLGQPLFPGLTGYHHQYCYAEVKTGSVLTEVSQLDTLDLTKVPQTADGSDLWNWLSFIGANDEKELDMAALLDPVIGEAVDLVKEFSKSEEFRLRQLYHEKWLSDQANDRNTALREGEAKGRAEGLQEGLAEGRAEGREEGLAEGEAKGRAAERERMVRAALARGVPAEQIAVMFDVDAAEVARLTSS